MTYAQPFLRLVVAGDLYGVEQFSFSMSLINDFGSAPDAPDEVPAGVISAVTDYFAGLPISGAAVLRYIKLNLIGTNGRYVSESETVVHDFTVPYPKGSGAGSPAPQLALAVSLGTARARGRAHAGRFYLPTPSVSLGADGRIDAALTDGIAVETVEFFANLHAALPGWEVGVTSDLGTGAQFPVTHVRVGRVLDTIRSRRTSLDEDYKQRPVVPA
jgi:hypothetical protein